MKNFIMFVFTLLYARKARMARADYGENLFFPVSDVVLGVL